MSTPPLRQAQSASFSGSAAIAVRDLKKSYAAVEAVRGISFTVRPGQTVGLLGGNGAGKTTTISMLLGVLTPSAGSIEILGLPLATRRYDILPRINFTSPYVDLPKRLSVTENLRVFAGLYGVRDDWQSARSRQLAGHGRQGDWRQRGGCKNGLEVLSRNLLPRVNDFSRACLLCDGPPASAMADFT